MLPIPTKDPLVELPPPTDDGFLNPASEEDADLLDTGLWDSEPDTAEDEDDCDDTEDD